MQNKEKNIEIKQKLLEATKNILEKNLGILDKPFCDKKIVLVYDKNSNLSNILSEAYISNLNSYKNLDIEIIDFDSIENDILKIKIMSLESDSTVVLVQSTNFRLDDFRLRLNLKNAWVWAIEHNHLSYIRDNEIENYADSIEYRTPYYDDLSKKLKQKSDSANIMKIVSKNWDELILEWGFEDMKQNTWNFEGRIRAWSFPIWENFTEIIDFLKVNWKVSIRAYPNENFWVEFPEVFTLNIKESLITWYSENTPKWFLEILEKIKKSEDNEVFIRELWFWLNPWITWEKSLNDINAFERILGFHISLWKKHQIYRKKFHRKITQRYHIDIFPDTDYIKMGDEIIFQNEKYLL